MSDIRFPSRLKPIVSMGYSSSRLSNITRVDVQNGAPRQGRDTYFEAVPYTVKILCRSVIARQAFWDFIAQIDGGAASFIMSLDSSMGPADHLCWITSAVSESTSDNINWEIGFTVTAERTYDQEDPWQGQALAAYEAFGDDAVPFIDSFYSFVNNPPFKFNGSP